MTSILLITHGQIGAELLKAATITFDGKLPTTCIALAIEAQDSLELSSQRAQSCFAKLREQTPEVLILTDLYGASPANIAHNIAAANPPTRVIAGLNLPMLLRILNYAHQNLATLAQKAFDGGRDGVVAPIATHII